MPVMAHAPEEALSERETFGPVRRAIGLGALVLFAVAVAPPLGNEAGRYLSLETVQYALLALAVPGLLIIAAPWRLLGLGDALLRRQLHSRPSIGRVALLLVPALIVLVAWRTPPLVDALAHHRALLALEVATVLPASLLIWLELVASPPSYPRLTALGRIPVAAGAMWVLWILAYLVGFAAHGAYPAYTHLARRALSPAADEQVAALILWLAAGVAFVPVLFASLMSFLRSEERRGRGGARPAQP